MDAILSNSIDLVVTSPPYPMIEMWDENFSEQNIEIGKALAKNDGPLAFELMHKELDSVWDEVYRVLKKGGIACVNIGDATRTIGDQFALYTNHSRIYTYMQKIGFSALPAILWRKQTNAPNKFMGSGMMPPGAYVTLEHEYVLVLRKGNKKDFKTKAEKEQRRASSFFWEERNIWFSDVWTDLKGTSQNLFDDKVRSRSAAYPFELPYRLITMFSVKGDHILDPFSGIGTTMYAAMTACRNSIGYEMDNNFYDAIVSRLNGIIKFGNRRITERLENHCIFVTNQLQKKKKFKYLNKNYRFPVMTRQETALLINALQSVKQTKQDRFEVTYFDTPQKIFAEDGDDLMMSDSMTSPQKPVIRNFNKRLKQRQLF
jgi:DNA modification methylase